MKNKNHTFLFYPSRCEKGCTDRHGLSRTQVIYSAFLFCSLLLTACGRYSSNPIQTFQHAEQGAYAADISADASLSVVSGVDGALVVWDLLHNKPLYQWSHQGEGNNLVTSIHIAADNSHVVTSDREAFALWSLSSGEPVGFWRIDESSVRDIAVSNLGQGILVGRGNGKVMYFEPQSGRRIEFLGHQEKINSVDLSPNGRYALTGSNDYVAYLWDTRNGQVIYSFTHPSRVTKVALDDQGRYAFTADSQKQATIWDLQTGQPVSELNYIQRQKIFSQAIFSEDGSQLLTGSPSRRLNLWDVQSGDEIFEWRVAPKEDSPMRSAVVYGVGFWPNNEVISQSSSGKAEVWKIE